MLRRLEEMSGIYARILDHFELKFQTLFSARFDKQVENDQVLDEIELYFILTINPT